MTAIGFSFVIPVFKGVGVVWTAGSVLWTVVTLVKIVLIFRKEDVVEEDLKHKSRMMGGIEGEIPDMDLYSRFRDEGTKEAELLALTKAFNMGEISAEEYQIRRNEIRNRDLAEETDEDAEEYENGDVPNEQMQEECAEQQ